MIQAICQQLATMFPDDPSSPGVTISWLKKQGEWYASAVRYHEPMGQGKEVIAKARGVILDHVLIELKSIIDDLQEPTHKCNS